MAGRVQSMRERYPGRVPIVVDQHASCKHALDKRKFLVPDDLTAHQFMWVLRKRMRLEPSEAIFLMCGDATMVTNSATAKQLHDRHGGEDGLLRLTCSSESVFGGGA